MATAIGERVLYIVNSNATAMQAAFTTAVDGSVATTIGANSLATAKWHAAQWQVSPVIYQADFGSSEFFSTGAPVPGALVGGLGSSCATLAAVDQVIRYHCAQVNLLLAANPTVTHVICSSHTPGVVSSGKWSGFSDASSGSGEAFDAWFGASRYLPTVNTGWTTGTTYVASNDAPIVGPKRYVTAAGPNDSNYLPYGRIGCAYTVNVGGNSTLDYEDPSLIRRIITDAVAMAASDVVHKTKPLYCGWGGSGTSAQPPLGVNSAYQQLVVTRGYTGFNVFEGSATATGATVSAMSGISPAFTTSSGANKTNIYGPTGSNPENANWLAQLAAQPVWLLMDPYIWGNLAYTKATAGAWNGFIGGLARGAWMFNQSSFAGTNGAPSFLYLGGCLAQGTVSEPNEAGIISYQAALTQFLAGRTWAETCLVAAQQRPTAIGKMGCYGDPLAQHFKFNSGTWL